MKTDLDQLLHENDLDALLIIGNGQNNPPMVYMTGGAHLSDAYLIKKKNQLPILYHHMMERDEAQKSGLETRNIEMIDLNRMMRSNPSQGSLQHQRAVALIQNILEDLDLSSGKVAIYGQYETGKGYAMFSALQTALPELTLVGETENPVLWSAMLTKDEDEIERIKKMGLITTEVVAEIADLLSRSKVSGNILKKKDDTPLTIGSIRRQINLLLAERGVENPHGTIFSMGRDAAVPHNVGNDQQEIELGKTIVFDIYPCEAGGGYFYDFTRTWSLGYATDETYRVYEEVRKVYHLVTEALESSKPFKDYQELACDIFEARGFATIRKTPGLQSGYVHQIGHGLGLNIHEPPSSRSISSKLDFLFPGTVFTIEPGLYFPDDEIGVRLEDTFYVKKNGQIKKIVDYPLDLILPVGQRS